MGYRWYSRTVVPPDPSAAATHWPLADETSQSCFQSDQTVNTGHSSDGPDTGMRSVFVESDSSHTAGFGAQPCPTNLSWYSPGVDTVSDVSYATFFFRSRLICHDWWRNADIHLLQHFRHLFAPLLRRYLALCPGFLVQEWKAILPQAIEFSSRYFFPTPMLPIPHELPMYKYSPELLMWCRRL
jgi:hypothetical protein